MITVDELSRGLFGAWRLAHLDPRGLSFFDNSIEGFWRSFQAALVAAPGYALLVALKMIETPAVEPMTRTVLIEGIAYAIGWTAYPLAAFYVVQALDRPQRYCGYIVAYNWANVLQVAVYLPVMALSASQLLPEDIAGYVAVATTLLVLYYQWFIARVALDIGGMPAATLVVLDLALALIINSIVAALHRASVALT
jgi:hypothetical protein